MKRFLKLFIYLLSIHCSALIITSALRVILFVTLHHQLSTAALADRNLQITAFIRGVWFDNVIGCYALALPLVVAVITAIFNYYKKPLFRFYTVFFSIFYAIVFLINVADIPYFGYFFKHINASIFEWFGYAGTTTGMVTGEKSYYLPIAIYLICTTGFIIWNIFLSAKFRTVLAHSQISLKKQNISLFPKVGILLVGACLIGLCFFGIRGRTGYNPIKVSAAYYCQDAFLNQLGVSPTFNLLTSIIDDLRPENKYLHLMDEQRAITEVQKALNRTGNSISPLATERKSLSSPLDSIGLKRPNVVLIMMESMSASLMKHFGQADNLTPFLDSLYTQSIGFKNFYSAGIHTNHGLYATLYSFPAIMERNLMKGSVIPRYSGLPTVLKDNGYYNLFFMTHESQYDNMNAFFRTNGYDEIYSQENYPKDKVANSFGVQDDYLYQYAIPVLNKQAQKKKPFFATLLSISNHPPYVIPHYFHPKSKESEKQIVEYADWSIKQFFNEARKQPWFNNTIFVLEGDHGKLVGKAENEMPQSYNHIPLIIYNPKLKPKEMNCFGGQIDVQPTLLGLLGIGYMQNNFGIDLLHGKRPCMFYTADNMIAARDEHYLYMFSPKTSQEFAYKIENGKPKSTPVNSYILSLKNYCFSMLQSAQLLVKQGKTLNHQR